MRPLFVWAYPAPMPMLPTPATSLAAHVNVSAVCRTCHQARALDLAELAALADVVGEAWAMT